jgi:signal transduction histidine kinase
MTGRFLENKQTEALAEDDFIVRKRPFIIPLLVVITISFAAIYAAGLGMQYGQGRWVFGVTALFILLALGTFTALFTQRQRDLVMLTEFQNALFASAARVDSQFCLILKKDGEVVYVDPGFQKLFGHINYRDIHDVSKLGEYGLLKTEEELIFDKAMGDNHPARQFINMPLPGNRTLKMVVSLEPLSRPKGYFLLRGREFVERPDAGAASVAPVVVAAPANLAPSALSLEALISHFPIAIAMINSQGTVLECNESFRKITDRIRHRKDGWDFLETVAPANRPEIMEKLRLLTGNTPDEHPLDIKILGEKEKSASLYLNLIQSTEGGEPQIVLHLIDTTEQKNLEMRYAHSQKMQAVGQLAGGVAHDFNNLLTAMIGFCDLLLMRHPAGDQSFADIMQVKQNANRAANLVRQLLAFSRRQTLQPRLLDMTEVLAELSNLVRRLIGENIELKMIHGRDIGMVKADQGQLEQVFINLAVNARDAMIGGGTLTLRTATVNLRSSYDIDPSLMPPSEEDLITPGNYVLVELVDTGTGIAPDVLQKIFEPFFSTKEVGAGTGLGLATVYGIIKQTGGYVYVGSTMGVGTRFQIYFPRFEAQANAVEEKMDKEPVGDLTGTGTILLVEDEAPVRSFAARALRNKGYNVLEADCGEAALEVIREHGDELDVIISDVIMPGMNGPEMIKRIMPQYPKVKVIFISGYAEDAFADSFGEDYEFNFLPKPFTLKQLAGKVKEVTQA